MRRSLLSSARAQVNALITRRRVERVRTLSSHLETSRQNPRLIGRGPTLSYSQFGEDAVLQSLVPELPGRYVDVGAGDPIHGSNTYALYLRGWRGVLIDPIRSNTQLAEVLRPGDTVLQAACSNSSGELTFFEFQPYEYSTTSLERVDELAQQGRTPIDSYSVPVVALREIPVVPDLYSILSIDVEGMELEVLMSNDWEAFIPELIVIEEWMGPLKEKTQVSEFLASRGYNLVAIAGVSSIYQHAPSH
jgi:FkbM family methyltransferase